MESYEMKSTTDSSVLHNYERTSDYSEEDYDDRFSLNP
jgi:hypothetical protein